MKIERFWSKDPHESQVESFCGGVWIIDDLINRSRDLPVFELPLAHIDFTMLKFNCPDLIEFCRHGRHVIECDLSYPIIMDFKGAILDGRHRICKALFLGHETILAKRFMQYEVPTQPQRSR